MPRHPLRRGLLASLTALFVLPVILIMMFAAASLLSVVGDASAAAVCRWISLAIGIMWAASVVTTVAFSSLLALAEEGAKAFHRRRRRAVDEGAGGESMGH